MAETNLNDPTLADQYEAEAKQLVRASWANTNSLPNPQLVTESLASGATPDVLGAYSDPELAKYMTAVPGGTGQKFTPDNGPAQPGLDVSTFDPKQYQGLLGSMKKLPQDVQGKLGFNSAVGQMPLLNTGYMSWIQQSSDPNTVKSWQAMLHERGLYQDASQYNHTNTTWGEADTAALNSYFIDLAAPEALWAKDPQRRNQAKEFLTKLGIDPGTLETQVNTDPAVRNPMIARWFQTQGKPAQELDSMHAFADRFGSENLPDPWRKIADPGILGMFGQTVGSVLNIPGNLAGMIPGVGGPLKGISTAPGNTIENLLAGNGLNVTNPTDVEKQKLSKQEQDMLAPALAAASGATGWLPFQAYGEAVTKGAIGIGMTAASAVQQGQLHNPLDAFDPNSALGAYAEKYKDDLMSAQLGEQWTKDHPHMAAIGNIVQGVIDDPLTAVTGGASLVKGTARIGLAVESLKGGEGLTAAQRALMGERSIRDISQATALMLIDPLKARAIVKRLDPKARLNVEMSQALIKVRDQPGSEHWIRMLVGLGAQDSPGYTKAVRDFVKFAKNPTNDAEAIRRELVNQFPHMLTHGAGAVEFKDHLKTLDRLHSVSEGDLLKMKAAGGIGDVGVQLNLNDEHGAAQTMHGMLAMNGVPEEKIGAFLDKWYQAAEGDSPARTKELQAARDKWKTDVEKAKAEGKPLPKQPTKSDFAGQLEDMVNTDFRELMESPEGRLAKMNADIADVNKLHTHLARGKSLTIRHSVDSRVGQTERLSQVSYLPTMGADGKITDSRLLRGFSQGTTDFLNKLDHQIQVVHETFKENVQLETDRLMATDKSLSESAALDMVMNSEAYKYMQAERDRMTSGLQQHADTIAPLGQTRPGPAVTGQMQKVAYLPFTPFELASFLNPALKKSEQLQAAVKMDAFMSMWKPIVLLRPSTMFRILMGDDTTRPAFHLALKGHPAEAIKAFMGATSRGLAAGYHLPGSKRFLSEADKVLGDNAAARMQTSSYASEVDQSAFVHYMPTEAGYEEGFRTWYKSFLKSPEIKVWAKAYKEGGATEATKALTELATTTKDPKLTELVSQNGMSPQQWAEHSNQWMSSEFSLGGHAHALDWLEKGAIDHKQFAALYKNDPHLFPIVTAPRMTMFSRNLILNSMKTGPDKMFHAMLEPMIHASRGRIYRSILADWQREIKEVAPHWDENKTLEYATVEANKWMQHSLYQGARTITGRSLRNAFPFWGATANMSRFWVRQSKMHPWIVGPGTHYLGWQEEQSSQPPKPTGKPNGWPLQALGFVGGDMLTADPAHAFFITNDGVGSFVPGMGPLFAPLLSAVAKDQSLMDTIGTVPGVKEQLQYRTGPEGGSPLYVGWLEKMMSGVGLMSPFHKPFDLSFVGGDDKAYDKKIDQKLQQMMANYYEGKTKDIPTRDDAAFELGKEQVATQAVGSVLPVSPSISDPIQGQKSEAYRALGNANTPAEKQAVAQQYPEIKPLLDYLNSDTSLDQKNAIANAYPWVIPYSTSIYSRSGKPLTQEEFGQDLAKGDVTVQGAGDYSGSEGYLPKIRQNWEASQGWFQMNQLQVAEANYLIQNPNQTKSSPEYKQWVATNVSPVISKLMEAYPAFGDAFLKEKRRDAAGLQANTRPLSTLMTTEVLPQAEGFETPTTVSWRKALVYRNEAQDQLYRLAADGATSQEKQAVADMLAQELQGLAAQDPTFAKYVTPFRMQQWQDVVNLGVMEQKAQSNG